MMWGAMTKAVIATGSEEVNSESEVAKDSHKVMEDTSSIGEKYIRRRNEKGNPDNCHDSREMIFTIILFYQEML